MRPTRQGTYFLKASLTFSPGVFEVGLRLVALALIFSALVAGDLADRFLSLAPRSWALFFALSAPLTVSPTSRESTQVAATSSPLGTSPAGFQNVRVLPLGARYDTGKAVEQRHKDPVRDQRLTPDFG